MGPSPAIDRLRAKIRLLEAGSSPKSGVLPFGVAALDARLPGGGLTRGALHEVAGAGTTALDGAAALFTAGIMARLPGPILWCLRDADLFAPGLAAAGLAPDRVIHVEANSEQAMLACFEEGLRHGGLGGAVAEIGVLPMNASRRLQLAAEHSGTLGISLRRWRRKSDAATFGQPTAAATRWRVSVLPSAFLPASGIGRPRWFLELLRNRAGETANFEVEGCDAKGRLALPAELADRVATPGARLSA